jgi:hypothetical protein
MTNDASNAVRMAARASLAPYYAAGYRGAQNAPPSNGQRTTVANNRANPAPAPIPETQEPPMASLRKAQSPKPVKPALDPSARLEAKPSPAPLPPMDPVPVVDAKPEVEKRTVDKPAGEKPAIEKPAKPAPEKPAKPAKPDDDGPILIPPA